VDERPEPDALDGAPHYQPASLQNLHRSEGSHAGSQTWETGAVCLAVPGKLLSIKGDDPLLQMGTVDFGGIRKQVSLAYVPGVRVGEYVIVHVGFALEVLDEASAQRTLDLFRSLGSLQETLGAEAG
jgi:hydrogenase expression/formation protein HypC